MVDTFDAEAMRSVILAVPAPQYMAVPAWFVDMIEEANPLRTVIARERRRLDRVGLR